MPWLGDFNSVMIKLNRFKTLVYPPSHDFLKYFFCCFRYEKILKEIQEMLGKC